MSNRLSRSILVASSVLGFTSVASAKSFLTDSNRAKLPTDTKGTCVVAAMLMSNGMGDF